MKVEKLYIYNHVNPVGFQRETHIWLLMDFLEICSFHTWICMYTLEP